MRGGRNSQLLLMEIRFDQNVISIPVINYKLPVAATTSPDLLQFCSAKLQGWEMRHRTRSEGDNKRLDFKGRVCTYHPEH